jgi:hypothetical protein
MSTATAGKGSREGVVQHGHRIAIMPFQYKA